MQALEKPLGLPPGLLAHAEEIRSQNGVDRLRTSIDETNKLRENDRAIYREGSDILQAEAAEDERARMKYGTDRWIRPASKDAAPKLYAQIGEIEGYLEAAAKTDNIVKAKLKDNEYHITLLGATDQDIERFVPSSRRATLAPTVEKETGKLRGCLNEVSRLETRRKRKIENLRARAKQDDIST